MEIEINFYNVEHGNCTHIITPLGQHILVDCGARSDKSIAMFIKAKYYKNVVNPRLDSLILTHPHKDHFSDIIEIRKVLNPKMLSRSEEGFNNIDDQDDEAIKSVKDMNSSYNIPILDAENILKNCNINGGVEIKKFYPPSNLIQDNDANSYSMVIVLKYANNKIVLTGDNTPTILESMLNDNEDFKTAIANADILLAPHHGRTSDFCQEFFDWVEPKLTIISDKEIIYESQEKSSLYYSNTRRLLVDNKERNVVSTRERGGVNIKVVIDSDGNLTASTNKDY